MKVFDREKFCTLMHGKTNTQVSDELKENGCNVTRMTLHNYRVGNTIPNVETACALATYLGCKVENLMKEAENE